MRVGRLRPQIDAWSLGRSDVAGAGAVQRQLLRDGGEQLADVLGGLGGGFEEEETGLLGVLLGLLCCDGALVRVLGHEIEFVAGEGDDDVLVGLALELLDPGFRFV